MNGDSKVFLILKKKIIFLMGFISALALKCWDCDGLTNGNCNNGDNPFEEDKFDKSKSLVDCKPTTDKDTAACIKVTGNFY